jgi:hypothetical protein
MHRLSLLFALVAFFLNPGLACTSGESDFDFGEEEMRAAVEGQWQFQWLKADGTSAMVTVAVAQAGGGMDSGTMSIRSGGRGFVRAASACDSRTFVRSAGACVDMSQMPVEVAYVGGDGAFQAMPIGGDFHVYGLSFRTGYLGIVLGDTSLTVTVRRDGTVESAQILSPEAPSGLTAQRLTR